MTISSVVESLVVVFSSFAWLCSPLIGKFEFTAISASQVSLDEKHSERRVFVSKASKAKSQTNYLCFQKSIFFREIVAVYEKFIEISWKSYGETLLRDLLTDIVEVLTFDGGFLAWGK